MPDGGPLELRGLCWCGEGRQPKREGLVVEVLVLNEALVEALIENNSHSMI